MLTNLSNVVNSFCTFPHAGKGTDAVSVLVDRVRTSGDIRADVDPTDLLRALVGFTYVNTGPDWEASARRLIDILMDGLQPPRPAV
jgi:hypothetical protein